MDLRAYMASMAQQADPTMEPTRSDLNWHSVREAMRVPVSAPLGAHLHRPWCMPRQVIVISGLNGANDCNFLGRWTSCPQTVRQLVKSTNGCWPRVPKATHRGCLPVLTAYLAASNLATETDCSATSHDAMENGILLWLAGYGAADNGITLLTPVRIMLRIRPYCY